MEPKKDDEKHETFAKQVSGSVSPRTRRYSLPPFLKPQQPHKNPLPEGAEASIPKKLKPLYSSKEVQTHISVRNEKSVKKPSPQKLITSANLEWRANTEVRYTFSGGVSEPLESERYRPHAPIPSATQLVVKPVPLRFRRPTEEPFSPPELSNIDEEPDFVDEDSLNQLFGTWNWKFLKMDRESMLETTLASLPDTLSNLTMDEFKFNPFAETPESNDQPCCIEIKDKDVIVRCIENAIQTLSHVLDQAKNSGPYERPEDGSSVMLIFKDGMRSFLAEPKANVKDISDLCPVIYLAQKAEKKKHEIFSSLGQNLDLDFQLAFIPKKKDHSDDK